MANGRDIKLSLRSARGRIRPPPDSIYSALVGSLTRRLGVTALSWLLVFGGLRAIVTQPERCGPVSTAEVTDAVSEAGDWFANNQNADGTWLYRYDRDSDEDIGGYNIVRHSGVTMSLYQAAAIGTPGALETADRGTAWALDNLVDVGDGLAFATGERVEAGASGLLLAGLVERREFTAEDIYDDEMAALATFLVGQIEPSGAVLAAYDPQTGAPVPGEYSYYFTGESSWALARMAENFPDDGYADPTRAVAHYLATERDATEELFPPVADHWAAYTLGEIDAWSSGDGLSEDELGYAERLAKLFGSQVRYESQRSNSAWSYVIRGRQTLAAGLGTLGEGLTSLFHIAQTDERLAPHSEAIAERALCVSSLLVDRQASAQTASQYTNPQRVQGAWFQFGITQMDDQQHAMSALLRSLPVIDSQSEEDE